MTEEALRMILEFKLDIQEPLVTRMPVTLVQEGDRQAHELRIFLTSGGKPYQVDGASVSGYMELTDGRRIVLTGSTAGNVVTSTLGDDCYSCPGAYALRLRLTVGKTVRTILRIVGRIEPNGEGNVVDPGHTIPTTEELKAIMQQFKNSLEAADAAAANANEKAGVADAAARKIDNMTVEAHSVEYGTPASADVSEVKGHKHVDIGVPKGLDGITPAFAIGEVKTVSPTSPAKATITGTKEHPVLNLELPQGFAGSIANLPIATSGVLGAVKIGSGIATAPDGTISANAQTVGARPSDWMPTAAEVGARPNNWTPTAAEVGARPNNWTPTAGETGALPADGTAKNAETLSGETLDSVKCGENLLDNWYLKDPINQRNTTILTGNSGPDRWRSYIHSSTLVPGEGVDVPTGGVLTQGPIPPFINGKEIACSALTSDGVLHYGNGVWSGASIDFVNDGAIQIYIPTLSGSDILFQILAKQNVRIVAVKMELGSTQTLAHQDSSGAWVLNDPPPNKTIELLKCQKYFYRYYYGFEFGGVWSGSRGVFTTKFPVRMNRRPDIVVSPAGFDVIRWKTFSDVFAHDVKQDASNTALQCLSTMGSGASFNMYALLAETSTPLETGEFLYCNNGYDRYIDFIAE